MQNKRISPNDVVSLSSEEFKALGRAFPNFPIILFVATLVDNKRAIPFPQKVLLKKTGAPNFEWELPNGFAKAADKTLEEAVTRIAKETIGAPARLHSIIGQRDESFGLICLIVAEEPLQESDILKYFHLTEFPWGKIIPDHKQFINSYTCQQIRRVAGIE